jgi:hypothetical protein
MKLGIMQPYFFPYVGYFSLIAETDRWVVFDTPQYDRKGWIHRNRVLKKDGDWKHIGLPTTKCPLKTAIKDVVIRPGVDWGGEIFRNLDVYRDARAPHYEDVSALLSEAFATSENNLSRLLVRFLGIICDRLHLQFDYSVFSEMDLGIGSATHPGDWALRISERLSADTYINPHGGRSIFSPEQFEAAGVELLFLKPNLMPYNQNRPEFVSGLSIVDVLMWNTVEQVNEMIHQCDIGM